MAATAAAVRAPGTRTRRARTPRESQLPRTTGSPRSWTSPRAPFPLRSKPARSSAATLSAASPPNTRATWTWSPKPIAPRKNSSPSASPRPSPITEFTAKKACASASTASTAGTSIRSTEPRISRMAFQCSAFRSGSNIVPRAKTANSSPASSTIRPATSCSSRKKAWEPG